MKLAVAFFIVCGFLLSCSLQQQVLFRSSGWSPNISPRTIAPYYYYADQDADDTNEMSHQLYELLLNEVHKRPAVSTFFKSSSYYDNKDPQSKLFRFLLFNQLKKSLFSSLPTVTFTSTSTSVSTAVSTITTLALQNCISSANFVNVAGVYSTTPCPGKKRSIEFDTGAEPSKVIPMETSRIARNDDEQNSDPYVLSSSFLDLQEESDVAIPRRVGFSQASASPIVIPKSTLVVTATSTTTSFSFVASTVKKPFTLAAAGALSCLPPGFVVC